MTTEDEARLAGIRERCKSPPWQEHDIGFLLRLLDVAHARIAQLDADYVQAQKDANVMIDEREAKVRRLEEHVAMAERDAVESKAEADHRNECRLRAVRDEEAAILRGAEASARADAAELRLSQVENTIRAAVGRFEAVAREYRDQMFVWDEGGEVLSALHELLVDLGFEPEPGQNEKSAEPPKEPGA